MPRYLIWFSRCNSYYNSRFHEFESLCSLYGIKDKDEIYGDVPAESRDSRSALPYVWATLPEEVAIKVGARATLIKFIVEVWGYGVSHEEALAMAHKVPLEERQKYLNETNSFGYRVQAFGKKIPQSEKVAMMNRYTSLFTGREKVDPKNPDNILCILEAYAEKPRAQGEARMKEEPDVVFMGRGVVDNDKTSVYDKYDLAKRPVLGPTTLDNKLAFMMSNWAEVKPGQMVLDPFIGTGGLAISCTHHGAFCTGADIDVRVVKGWKVAYVKNKEAAEKAQGDAEHVKDVFTNFKAYGLRTPEVIISDNSTRQWRLQPSQAPHSYRPVETPDRLALWGRSAPFADAIVTDPPYGIRASAKKVSTRTEHEVTDKSTYLPQKVQYDVDRVSVDLLGLASEALVDGGRLVFLLPIELTDLIPELSVNYEGDTSHLQKTRKHKQLEKRGGTKGKITAIANGEMARNPEFIDESYHKKLIPEHEDLELVGSSLQILAAGLGRLVVKMVRKPRSPA